MSEVTLQFVKDVCCDHDCGDCEYFGTNGFIAPDGKCSKHPEFGINPCMDSKTFPDDATICIDFKRRIMNE